jgi:hypothetical protein
MAHRTMNHEPWGCALSSSLLLAAETLQTTPVMTRRVSQFYIEGKTTGLTSILKEQ